MAKECYGGFMIPLQFYDLVQKKCLPGIWSKGVSLARSQNIIQDPASLESEGELRFRVKTPERPVAFRVELWPEDEDWHCDCRDKNEICSHVAGAVVFSKNATPEKKSEIKGSQVLYAFSESTQSKNELSLERFLFAQNHEPLKITQSLTALFTSIQGGRLSFPPLTATQVDFSVDALLTHSTSRHLDPPLISKLFKALAGQPNLQFEGHPIQISSQGASDRFALEEASGGFELRLIQKEGRRFKNGALLENETLQPLSLQKPLDRSFFEPSQMQFLLTELIPSLQEKGILEKISPRLPVGIEVVPEIDFQLRLSLDTLEVCPRIQDLPKKQGTFYYHSEEGLRQVLRDLKSRFHLQLGQSAKFSGDEAVDLYSKLEPSQPIEKIQPQVGFENQLEVRFVIPRSKKEASFQEVQSAWRHNRKYVPLMEGGWASVPKEWFNRYGEEMSQLLLLQKKGPIPAYRLPEVVSYFKENLTPLPKSLERYDIEQKHVSPFSLPTDLKASLRNYQLEGVKWLHQIREWEAGGLLADDMGLGKTLQAISALRTRALIICPTSVLFNWMDQIRQFRPALRVSLFHGQNRRWDPTADVVLTSYTLLRLELPYFLETKWDTIILDEAHIIKNPESQIAQAAHSLSASFRIALTGTPIENQISDLWSLFQFLNPTLLGEKGELDAAGMKKRIRPFFLRRLKKDVSLELPPRIETTLCCELTEDEKITYTSLLKQTKQLYEEQGETLSILELLLRMRQACCHPSLLPGKSEPRSSKTDLLVQSLIRSREGSHRSLVFSQWTSFLDLIEPHLQTANISYLRLDGSSPNRKEIVDTFQNDSSYSVLLLSLKAGGVGITLTGADHVYITDPWWNPFVEDQAADRAHRIGQTRTVLIHRLIALQTIEEKVLELQAHKRSLAADLLEGSLTKEDIRFLLTSP